MTVVCPPRRVPEAWRLGEAWELRLVLFEPVGVMGLGALSRFQGLENLGPHGGHVAGAHGNEQIARSQLAREVGNDLGAVLPEIPGMGASPAG